VRFIAGDALELPFEDGLFDAVTAAFGVRNFEDLERGLDEVLRVLRPGGRAVILEFAARRGGPLDAAFRFYFHHLLPRLGGWISGSKEGRDAYGYLPASVLEFPSPAELARILERRGFHAVRHRTLSLGVVSIHIGFRPPAGCAILAPGR
jgi:demethylmenaquinone methyltransferase/2-methoxy-6-polyprenyl-1,4-benzoquinol methylase